MNSKEGNVEGVFYILVYTKALFTFNTIFKCPCGQEFNGGDMAVAKKYYQRWGQSKFIYVLLRGAITITRTIASVTLVWFFHVLKS
jgi:hypothetical protein